MQVVIALVVTPEGFPLAYEVLAGNTSDKTTLREFLHKIETQYGKAQRIWVMDRGIPTEEVLTEMRQSDPPVYYLVGTPKGRLSQLEQKLLGLPFTLVRSGIEVKLLVHEQELYVLAKSRHRIDKQRSMRRRQLRALIKRLKELHEMKFNSTQTLLLKLGAANCTSAEQEGGRVGLVQWARRAPQGGFRWEADSEYESTARNSAKTSSYHY